MATRKHHRSSHRSGLLVVAEDRGFSPNLSALRAPSREVPPWFECSAHSRRRAQRSGLLVVAEDRGFEPLRAFTQHAFQACALGHYANPPRASLRAAHRLVISPSRGDTSPNSPRAGRQQGSVTSVGCARGLYCLCRRRSASPIADAQTGLCSRTRPAPAPDQRGRCPHWPDRSESHADCQHGRRSSGC